MKLLKKMLTAAVVLCLMLSLVPTAHADSDDARFEGKTWDQLVEEFIAQYEVRSDWVAFGYKNLVTGEEHYHNGDTYMVAASMFKVPLTMVYAEKVANGEMDWSTTVGAIPLETLVEGCIIDSNNAYATTLWSVLGNGAYRTYREVIAPYMGEDAATVDPKYYENNYFTPRQLIYCLDLLYNQQERFPRIIETMQRAEPSMYFKYAEQRFDIAHKYGYLQADWHTYINDCGLAFTDDPIALVCFTDNQYNAYDVLTAYATLMCDYTQYHTARRKALESRQAAAFEDLSVSSPEAQTAPFASLDREEVTVESDPLLPFIGRVAAVTAGLLLLAGIASAFKRKKIRFLWIPLTIALGAGALYASMYITSSGALLHKDTVAAESAGPDPQAAAVAFLEDLKAGDYEGVYAITQGYSSFGLENDADNALDQTLWQALRDSIDYSLQGDCVMDSSVHAVQAVRLRSLQLSAALDAIRSEAQRQLNTLSQSRTEAELLDENGNYREEIVQEALAAAAAAVLSHTEDYTADTDVTLTLARSNGVWYVQPDDAFITAVTGQ